MIDPNKLREMIAPRLVLNTAGMDQFDYWLLVHEQRRSLFVRARIGDSNFLLSSSIELSEAIGGTDQTERVAKWLLRELELWETKARRALGMP